jgi:hypothetical protein
MTSLLQKLALASPRPAVATCYRSACARSLSSSRALINAAASAAAKSNVSFSGSGFLFPFHLGVGQQLLHARISGSNHPSPQNQISTPATSTSSSSRRAPLSHLPSTPAAPCGPSLPPSPHPNPLLAAVNMRLQSRPPLSPASVAALLRPLFSRLSPPPTPVRIAVSQCCV